MTSQTFKYCLTPFPREPLLVLGKILASQSPYPLPWRPDVIVQSLSKFTFILLKLIWIYPNNKTFFSYSKEKLLDLLNTLLDNDCKESSKNVYSQILLCFCLLWSWFLDKTTYIKRKLTFNRLNESNLADWTQILFVKKNNRKWCSIRPILLSSGRCSIVC